jgi:RNA methyltransferase, TrmH family
MKTHTKLTRRQLKDIQKLTQKKYRQKERKFLVEGVHLVEEALKSDWAVEAIIQSDGFEDRKLRAESKEVPVFTISDMEMQKLTDTVTSQGVVAIVKMKEYALQDFWRKLSKRSIIVVLDDVADPGNVGTILRTCDWFGVDAVLLNKDSVELYNPKVLRSTMGAIFHLPILIDFDSRFIIQDGKKAGFKVVSTVLEGGKSLNRFPFPEQSIIVFGNEAHGVSKEIQHLADEKLTIPKFGRAESLNVAISCGIILNSARTTSD